MLHSRCTHHIVARAQQTIFCRSTGLEPNVQYPQKSAWSFDHSLFGVDTYYRRVEANDSSGEAGGLYVMVVSSWSVTIHPQRMESYPNPPSPPGSPIRHCMNNVHRTPRWTGGSTWG